MTEKINTLVLAYEYIIPGNQHKIKHILVLTNRIAPQQIALESCSNPEKTWQALRLQWKRKFFGFGFLFFCE